MFSAWPLFITEIGLVALSLGCIALDFMLPARGQDRGRGLASLAMGGLTLLLVILCFQWGRFGTVLGGSFTQDGLSFFFKIIFLSAGILVLSMAKDYQSKVERGHSEFILLILFSLTGMVFLVSATDFLLFFVALETLTISVYIMTAYLRKNDASIEAGVKYLVLGALSTALFLYGLSFVYGATGSTSYAVIQAKLAVLPAAPQSFLFGAALIVCALGFKIAAVPFHLWTPDIYEGAPTPVTAYLAIASKAAGFAALLRVTAVILTPAHATFLPLFAVLSALTIFYGNLGAIPQTNIKRLMGYSSIGHAGYLLIGLAAFGHSGKEALSFYLLSYLFSTGGVFVVIVALSNIFKTDSIAEYAGLSKRSPLAAATMLLALLSLAGVPPLAGFFAKFWLLWSGVKAGLLWLALVGVLNVITSLYYYLKIVKVMYVDKPLDTTEIKLTFGQRLMHYVCILGILILGIYPGPFVRLAEQAFLNLR